MTTARAEYTKALEIDRTCVKAMYRRGNTPGLYMSNGDWFEGKWHGYVVIKWTNGNLYQGHVEHNVLHGEGHMVNVCAPAPHAPHGARASPHSVPPLALSPAHAPVPLRPRLPGTPPTDHR